MITHTTTWCVQEERDEYVFNFLDPVMVPT